MQTVFRKFEIEETMSYSFKSTFLKFHTMLNIYYENNHFKDSKIKC